MAMEMDAASDFLAKFYDVKGETYGERRRNLFMLLQSYKSADESVRANILASLSPRNHMESVFKIETLMFFRCYDALLEMLITSLDGSIRKIFRQRWFAQRLFDNISSEGFVSETLPKMPVVNRKRLLSALVKYCKDDQKMDQIFDSLLNAYGLDLARTVLPACSVDKIENILDSYQITLKLRELIFIYYRHQDVFITMLEKSRSHIKERNIKKLHKFVSTLDLKYCFELGKEKLHWTRRFGKIFTRKFITKHKSDVLVKPTHYISSLDIETVGEVLTMDEKIQALINTYPEKLSDYQLQPVCTILQLIPRDKKYEIYSKTFHEKYNQTLFDNPDQMPEWMVEHVQDVEEREKWIPLKISDDPLDFNFLHLHESHKSFNLIKSKINFTSTYRTREKLLEKLVDLYKYSKDKELLIEILKYACKRHRNDQTLTSLFSELYYHCNIADLDDEHWKYLFEIREIAKVKHYHLSCGTEFFLKHLEYFWRHKIPIREKVFEYIEKYNLEDCLYSIRELEDNEFQEALLSVLLEVVPQKEYKDEKTHVNLLYVISKWNKRNPKDRVQIQKYPTLINSLKEYLEKDNHTWQIEPVVLDLLRSESQDESSKAVLEVFCKKCLRPFKEISIKVILWHFKTNPEALTPYADNIIKFLYDIVKYKHAIWCLIKKNVDSCFYKKSVEYGLENYDKNRNKTLEIIKILAFLMKSEHYIAFVSKHIPTDKMETDEENDDKYLSLSIETAIARSFVACQTLDILPLLLQFCVRDTLRVGLTSLQYYFIHSPIDFMREIIAKLPFHHNLVVLQNFSFARDVEPARNITTLLKSIFQTESTSVRKRILEKALKYAKRNPSTELYELILQASNFELFNDKLVTVFEKFTDIPLPYKLKIIDIVFNYTVTHNEENVLPKLGEIIVTQLGKDLRKIPVEYKSNFIKLSILHCQMHSEKCALKNMITNFIRNIDETFLYDVPVEVCNAFIDFYFLSDNQFFPEEMIYSFIVCYVCNSPDTMADKWSFIFHKINEYQNLNSKTFVGKVKSKQKIVQLFSAILTFFESKDAALIKEFQNSWSRNFHISDCFAVFCYLRILLILKESKDDEEICKQLCSLLEEIYSMTSSTYLFDMVAYTFKQGYDKLFKNYDEKSYSICVTLYELSKSIPVCVFIILLLPKTSPSDENLNEKYTELLKSLSCHEEAFVKLKYNLCLCS